MGKPRTLEHGTWSDEHFGELSRDARLLAIGIITHLADDEGRLKADARYLRKEIFGYDADVTLEHIDGWLREIAEKLSNFQLYEVDGKRYMWLSNFAKKQNIRYVVKSTLPAFTPERAAKFNKSKDCEKFPEVPENSCSRVARAVGLGRVGLGSKETTSLPPDGGSDQPFDSSSEKAFTAQQERVRKITEACNAAGILPTPPPPRVAKWISKFGEDLVLETLADERLILDGKGVSYFQSILENRLANPSSRPSARANPPPRLKAKRTIKTAVRWDDD